MLRREVMVVKRGESPMVGIAVIAGVFMCAGLLLTELFIHLRAADARAAEIYRIERAIHDTARDLARMEPAWAPR